MLSFTACVDGKSGEFYALDVSSISYMNLKMHWNQSEVIHSITDPLGPNPPNNRFDTRLLISSGAPPGIDGRGRGWRWSRPKRKEGL